MRSQWRETKARVWLRPPAELIKFLEEWLLACEACEGTSAAGEAIKG